jgi:hypothetical protein
VLPLIDGGVVLPGATVERNTPADATPAATTAARIAIPKLRPSQHGQSERLPVFDQAIMRPPFVDVRDLSEGLTRRRPSTADHEVISTCYE